MPGYPTLAHYDRAEFQIEGTTLVKYKGRSGPSGSAKVAKVPRGVTWIGAEAFYKRDDLINIQIPNGVTSIGERAFSDCKSLISIQIPDSVTSIDEEAFFDCESLTDMRIPAGVTTIRVGAFFGCRSLTTIRLPERLAAIEPSAFCGCRNLTGIEIPAGVTLIDESAFCGCRSLTSIRIPARVAEIGEWAFSDCGELEWIQVAAENPVYRSEGNCLIERKTNTLVLGCKNSAIPAGVTSIGGWAFSGCENLTKIKIPAGVTSIGGWAFSWCPNLKKILYDGTTEEWKRLRKDSDWDHDTGDYTVRCTDGTVAKDGTVKRGFGLRSLFKKPRNE